MISCVCTKRSNSTPTASSCDRHCIIKLIEGNFPLLQTRERQVMFVAASHLSFLTRYSKFSTDVMPSSCIFHSIFHFIFSFFSLCIHRGCTYQLIKSDQKFEYDADLLIMQKKAIFVFFVPDSCSGSCVLRMGYSKWLPMAMLTQCPQCPRMTFHQNIKSWWKKWVCVNRRIISETK